MEMMQWAILGGEKQVGGISLANHCWWVVLVASIHEGKLECQEHYGWGEKKVCQAGAAKFLGQPTGNNRFNS
jgi:hypothetical protein